MSGLTNLENWIQYNGGTPYTPHATAAWDIHNNPYMSGDPMAAEANAMVWALTGNQANANNAISILNAWSSTLTSMTDDTPANQSKLECGWNLCHFVAAAELLATCTLPPGVGNGGTSGWTSANITQFKSMLTLMTGPGGSGGPANWAGYMPTYHGNWDAATMNSTMAIAIFNNDSALFQNVINHFNGTDQTKTAGDWGYLEGYVSSNSANLGQCEESGRDQGHVQMGLGNYLSVCQLAWKQGVDLYSTDNNLLLSAMEYTNNYNLGGTVPYVEFPDTGETTISSISRGIFCPIDEVAYQHYNYLMGLAMPYTLQVLQSTAVYTFNSPNNKVPYRPEPQGENTGMGMGTLSAGIFDQAIAYSGFDYATTGSAPSLTDGSSDYGWTTSTWTNSGTIVSPGLSYSSLPVLGLALEYYSNTPSDRTISPSVMPSGYTTVGADGVTRLGAPGTTLWLSFLIDPTGTQTGSLISGLDLFGYAGGGSEKLTVGVVNGANSSWGVGNPYTATYAYATDAPQIQTKVTAFLVVEIQFTTGNSTINMWVDPPLGATPPTTPDATISTLNVGAFNITEFKGNLTSIGDELSIGTSWLSVTSGGQ
jgi:hypothetical protein